LLKHKKYLRQLENKKNDERENMFVQEQEKEFKEQQFREQAQKKRSKIREMQDQKAMEEALEQAELEMEFEKENEQPLESMPAYPKKAAPLTEDNLSKLGSDRPKSTKSKQSSKSKKGRPAWATTEKMQEEEKEKEIDDLIEFAFDLDYEKYLEDYEVRQALAII